MNDAVVAALRRNLQRALYDNRLDEAEAALARLEREDPLAVQARGGALELLLRRDRLDEAAALAAALVVHFPASARILYLAGQVAYRQKDYPRAVAHLRESLRVADTWRCRHWLGKALTQAGELAEAEGLLTDLVAEHPDVWPSLGWALERKDELDGALAAYERALAERPDSAFLRQAGSRIRARLLGAADLSQEVEALLELGEEIPPDLLPEYVEGLLATGRGDDARRLLAELGPGLDQRTACRVGWVCHRVKAVDLGYRFLLHSLASNLHSAKHLNALEADAAKAGRLPELGERLRALAVHTPRLWGWVKRVEKRLAREG